MIKRRNSGKITQARVATNCRNINYLIDKFDMYSDSTNTVSIIGDFEKKNYVCSDIQIPNELIFDKDFSEMESTEIYSRIFGKFFDYVLDCTNVNYKFKTFVKNFQTIKKKALN